ncbi:50S ribosomal protein L23 [Patescibacteria group bacterium]|nr:50S ribosomal protein L23 [Patescibacteria group bacterium]
MPFSFLKKLKEIRKELDPRRSSTSQKGLHETRARAKQAVDSHPKEHEAAPQSAPVIKKKVKRAPSFPSVLLNPHITEKATLLGEKGQYVFRVQPQATKDAVKQSVEALYGVAVRNVRLIKKPAKKIRIGRREGVKQGLKKAVVQLKAGESIEVISR